MPYLCCLLLAAAVPPTVALAPDGKTLVAADAAAIRVRDLATGKDRLSIPLPSANAVAIAAEGRTVAAAAGPVVHLFDSRTGKPIGQLTGHGAAVRSVACFPDGGRLVSGAADGQVRLWDLGTRRATRAIRVDEEGVVAVAASPDGERFAVASPECAHLFDASTGFRLMFLRPKERAARPAYAVAFSPDGRTVAVGHADGQVRLYEALTGAQRAALAGPPGAVRLVTFAPTGQALACPGTDGAVRLWDLAADSAREVKPGDESLALASGGASGCPPTRDRPAFTPMKPADAWEALDGHDAAKAYRAMWSLALGADGAALLVREMKDVSAQIKAHRDRVARLIADLDADAFGEREKASAALAALGADVYDELDQALKARPTLERKRRIERLLRSVQRPTNRTPTGLTRRLRAVEALEYAGTPEARAVVERLTRADEGRLRASAKASLARMKK